MPPIQDHPLRYELANELHARPFPAMQSPSTVIYLAVKQPRQAVHRDRALDLQHLKALLDDGWVVRRKAEVVAAVNGGLLTIDEVLERYSLTLEEFASWQRAVDRSGMQGLRVTRIQHYRDLYERQLKY